MLTKEYILKMLEDKDLSISELVEYQFLDTEQKVLPVHLWKVKLSERYKTDLLDEYYVLARSATEAERIAIEHEDLLGWPDAEDPNEVFGIEVSKIADYVYMGSGVFPGQNLMACNIYSKDNYDAGNRGTTTEF